jgi:single-strand DNA-binding protein
MGLNRAQLIGNFGADPELKYTDDGRAVSNFSLATNEVYFDKKTGEKQELTEWHRIVAFGKLAETIAEYFKKGSPIYLEGKIQTREYSGEKGERRWSTSIVMNFFKFLGSNGKRRQPGPDPEEYDQPKGSPVMEDDIPF